MNELLVGMRVIHQVLPAIMKKLGIDEEFKLDTSELRTGDYYCDYPGRTPDKIGAQVVPFDRAQSKKNGVTDPDTD
jgi:hypothetical protein